MTAMLDRNSNDNKDLEPTNCEASSVLGDSANWDQPREQFEQLSAPLASRQRRRQFSSLDGSTDDEDNWSFTSSRSSTMEDLPISWKRSIVSVGALVVFAALLVTVLEWHAATTANRNVNRPFTSYFLFHSSSAVLDLTQLRDNPPQPPQDDDGAASRDAICRDYIVQFLNGTTDAKDECQGMSNAWSEASCQKNGGFSWITTSGSGNPQLKSSTTSSLFFSYLEDTMADNVVPDDDFENWECCQSISEYYGKHCQPPQLNAFKLLGVMLVLVVCGSMKHLIRRIHQVRWMPDAGAYVLIGATVGLLLRLINAHVVQSRFTFDNDLFLQVLLPPIIFEAALTIDKQAFRRDLFPILTFAILGTGVSAVGIGYMTYYVSQIGWGSSAALPLLDSLLFGALMSSIDPVATLSILSSVGIRQSDTLYTLVFGESLLNDGVAIVLFDSLIQHMGDKDVVDRATVHDILLNFVVVTTGSILVGAICAATCTWYFWALQGQAAAVSEVALFFAWALIPYYIADGLHLSGIISIMVMGFMMDYYVIGGFQSDEGEWMEYMEMRHYDLQQPHPVEPCFARVKQACLKAFSGKGHILAKSRHHVGFVAEVISSTMETAIFAYLGLFLFNGDGWNFKFMTAGLVSCVSSRIFMVLALSLLINACVWIELEGKLGRLWRSIFPVDPVISLVDEDSLVSGPDFYDPNTKVYLDAKTQLILFSAGVRGAVSYALVQNIPLYNVVTKHGSSFKPQLKAMTSATIAVLLFGFGALTYFTVQRDFDRGRRHRNTGTADESADPADPDSSHRPRRQYHYHPQQQQQQQQQQGYHLMSGAAPLLDDLHLQQQQQQQPLASDAPQQQLQQHYDRSSSHMGVESIMSVPDRITERLMSSTLASDDDALDDSDLNSSAAAMEIESRPFFIPPNQQRSGGRHHPSYTTQRGGFPPPRPTTNIGSNSNVR